MLGLVFSDGGGATQCVEVVLEQRFFGHVIGCLGHGRGRHGQHAAALDHLWHYLVHVARHQLQLGIAVAGATGIGQGDPAGDVQLVIRCGQFHHIVRTPRQAAGEVAQLQVLLDAAGVVQRHDQRGAVTQVGGHIAKHQAARDAGLNALTDLQHHAVVGGQYGGRLRDLSTGRGVGTDDADVLPYIFFQQLLGREQIKVEILLQYLEAAGCADAAQQGRFGPHFGADIAKRQCQGAGFELHSALVFHQSQVVVVNGHRNLLLVCQGAARLHRLRVGALQGKRQGHKGKPVQGFHS